MATFDSFLPYILPYAHGASDLAIYQALRDTAIDFCRRTLVVQRWEAMNVIFNSPLYVPNVPNADLVVHKVMDVFWNGRLLTPVGPEDVNSDVVLQGADIGTNTLLRGSPVVWFQKYPGEASIYLHPVPTAALTNGLTIKSAFIPTTTASTLDDLLFNEHVEAIAAGTLARLVAMPNEPFSAPALAPSYKAVYEAGVNEAKRYRAKGKTLAQRRVQPVKWP